MRRADENSFRSFGGTTTLLIVDLFYHTPTFEAESIALAFCHPEPVEGRQKERRSPY